MSWLLENNFVSVALNDDGSLEKLINKKTRHNYISIPGNDVWKIVFRDKNSLDNVISCTGQKGKIVRLESAISVSYKNLRFKGITLQIELVFDITLSDNDETKWRLWIANKKEGIDILEVWFPIISGIRGIGGEPARDRLIYPTVGGIKMSNPLSKFGSRNGSPGPNFETRRLCQLYPGIATMQWFELGDKKEGLYMASYDKTLQTTCLNIRKNYGVNEDQDNLLLSFVKYPCLRKGKKWKSEPFVVSPHNGDWHIGSQKYKRWARTWMVKPNPPQWIKDMVGWQLTILKHQYGEVSYFYKDIPKLFADAKRAGLNTLFLMGWHEGGHDNEYPEYRFDPQMGGKKKLCKALKDVSDKGGKVLLYIQGVQMSPNSAFYKKHGRKVSAKDIHGHEYKDVWNYFGEGTLLQLSARQFLINACPSTKEWQGKMVEETVRAGEVNPAGYFFDQVGGQPCYLCFDKEHAHKPALAMGPARVNLFKRIMREVRKKDLDQAVACEMVCDAILQFFDISQPTWGLGEFTDPSGTVTFFSEMFHYTFPEYIHTLNIDNNDYARVNYALTMGYRFDVSINRQRGTLAEANPEFVGYLRKMSELRQKYRRLLLYATFIDNEKFTIDNECLTAKAHINGKELAVIVWNNTTQPESFSLKVPGYVMLKSVDIDNERPTIKSPERLEPNEVRCYFYYEKP